MATAACELFQSIRQSPTIKRFFHGTVTVWSVQAGKYKPTTRRTRPLTYEQANPPPQIAHRKAWNSWNTTTLEGGLRKAKTAIDDLFIRKFVNGTFHKCLVSEVIIKRQHNIIRIAAIMHRKLSETKFCFLIGYTEELLGYWLQCPIKLEIQFVDDPDITIFKYI